MYISGGTVMYQKAQYQNCSTIAVSYRHRATVVFFHVWLHNVVKSNICWENVRSSVCHTPKSPLTVQIRFEQFHRTMSR